MPADGETIDAFHRGRFRLVQPAAGAHRAGLDALILAAALPSGFAGEVADLGAGAGAAGLAVASRCPKASVLLVERAPEMVAFAQRTLVLPENRALARRVSLLAADVALAGKARQKAGLCDRSVDFVVMNPPFNAGDDRGSPHRLRREAHAMTPGLLEAWVRTAAAIVRPGGGLALVFSVPSLQATLTALEGRFGGAEIVPVHPRAGSDAIRIVLRARHGSRAGPALKPPLVLHGTGSAFSQRADAICNGRRSLFGD